MMTTVDQLLSAANERRIHDALTYAGALTPAESFEFLQVLPASILVDVRTQAELDWIGRPLVEQAQYFHIEWTLYPGGARNGGFIDALKARASVETPILLLCRSAVRSKAAAQAAAQAGFSQVFDILEGFEGNKDAEGHRKSVGGWCHRGLPWTGA